MAYNFTVPGEANYGFIRYLIVLVRDLMRFLAPAFYCQSWAPWVRIIITVAVIVVLVVIYRSSGLLPSVYTDGAVSP